MPIDLWSFESLIYPMIDAAGMREEKLVELKVPIGEGNNVSVKIRTLDDKPLDNARLVKAKDLGFSINYWKDKEKPWFRVDTDNGFLHFHLEWNCENVADHVPLDEGEKLKAFRKGYEEMTIWTVRLEELGLLRHREEGLWSTSEIMIFHILLLRLSSPPAKEADIIRIHSKMMGEAIHPEKVSKIIEKFREAGILSPQPSKSLALTSRAYDIWFSRHIRYWGKIFDPHEIVKEEKLRTLIGSSIESLLVSPSRSTLDSKLRRLAGKLSATFCRL